MLALTLKLNGDGAFEHFAGRTIHHLTNPITVAGLDGGMESGKPSVAIGFELEDGSCVLSETSLALFLTAADGLLARFGDPRT